jgi:deoxyribonuclease V
MIACVDVYYGKEMASVSCILIDRWTDESPVFIVTKTVDRVNPYTPGQFYLRELPCLLTVLEKAQGQIDARLDAIVIDGYVWLDPEGTPGLGTHLYHALGQSIPVVGVAKSPFKSNPPAQEVYRGTSKKPLYVTSVGIPLDNAVKNIKKMHGPYRIPGILKLADRVSRECYQGTLHPLHFRL